MKLHYKNIFIISSIFLISSCGGGGGGGSAVVAKLAAVITSFASSLNTSEVGSTVDISWSSTNSSSCTAAGSWSGTKSTSGTESVTISSTGSNSFTLTCIGEGGNDSSSLSVDGFRNIAGITVDGYITGASIFIDQDDDFQLGSDEDSTTSDSSGAFIIKHSNGTLVSMGGQDLDTLTQIDSLMLLRSLNGYSASNFSITPVTTIANFLPDENIFNLLGIDPSIDILTVDPVSSKGDGGINDFHYEKGNQLTVLALSLFNINNTLMSSSPSYSTRDYFQAIAEEIKKEYTITSSKVDIENQTFITNVFENIIATKSITITESSKVNTVKALSSVLPIIAVNTSDDITTSLINFALNTLQNDVVSIANGQADASLVASYNSDIFNYIATDQNIDANSLIPNIFSTSDSAETPEDVMVTINVISNDSYNMNSPISLSLTQPSNGSASSDGSGLVNYTPNPNYNGNDSFTYTITQGDKTSTGTVNIIIKPVNDSPVLNLASTIQVSENQTSVSSISTSDEDGDDLTLSLSGTDATSFSLTNAGILSFITAPDYEVKNSYSITISATDGVETVSKNITVAITNVNDVAPEFSSTLTFSIAENQTAIGQIFATDVEGDSISFTVSGSEVSITSAGVLSFSTAPDYETKSSYTAIVTASDGLNATSQDLTIAITNLNDIVPIFSSGATFNAAENQKSIGTVIATDEEGDTISFTVSGSEVSITSAGVLSFISAPDFESKSSYSAVVKADDGVNSVTQSLTINITNLNDVAPIISSTISFTIPENTSTIGTLSIVDPEGGTFTFTTGGSDGALINISSTGVMTFKTPPDFESKTSYSFTVSVSDGVNSSTKTLTISITNVDELPTSGYRVPPSIDVIETKE